MKKTFYYILIISFFDYVGCYSSRNVNKEMLYTLDSGEPADVVTIIMKDEKKLVVDEGIYEFGGDTLYVNGINKTNTMVYGQNIDLKIAFDDIQSINIEEFDGWRTTGCIAVGAVGFSIIIALGHLFQGGNILPGKCEDSINNW